MILLLGGGEQNQESGVGHGRDAEHGDTGNFAEGSVFPGVYNPFETKVEEPGPWVNMAETLPESVRKKSTGMDVRMMHDEDLKELYVKIGTRLQEAKESSLQHGDSPS